MSTDKVIASDTSRWHLKAPESSPCHLRLRVSPNQELTTHGLSGWRGESKFMVILDCCANRFSVDLGCWYNLDRDGCAHMMRSRCAPLDREKIKVR